MKVRGDFAWEWNTTTINGEISLIHKKSGVFQKHPILVDKYVLVNFAQTAPYLRKVAFYG